MRAVYVKRDVTLASIQDLSQILQSCAKMTPGAHGDEITNRLLMKLFSGSGRMRERILWNQALAIIGDFHVFFLIDHRPLQIHHRSDALFSLNRIGKV